MTLHKEGCISLVNEDEPERIVNVDWGEAHELYPVRIKMTAYDRVGLLRDVTLLVSEEHAGKQISHAQHRDSGGRAG